MEARNWPFSRARDSRGCFPSYLVVSRTSGGRFSIIITRIVPRIPPARPSRECFLGSRVVTTRVSRMCFCAEAQSVTTRVSRMYFSQRREGRATFLGEMGRRAPMIRGNFRYRADLPNARLRLRQRKFRIASYISLSNEQRTITGHRPAGLKVTRAEVGVSWVGQTYGGDIQCRSRRGRRTRRQPGRHGREEFEEYEDEKVVRGGGGDRDGEAKGQRGSISVKEI